MGKFFNELSQKHQEFIARQKVFFVATAVEQGRVSVSPKGMDSFAVLSPNRVIWLNVTGSGNETAAHVHVNPRMTLMFCAFDGDPLILRIYGDAKVFHPRDQEYADLSCHLPKLPGGRNLFDVTVKEVQTSCGMGVPLYEYIDDRDQLNLWVNKKDRKALHDYWDKHNKVSIDGLPTYISNS